MVLAGVLAGVLTGPLGVPLAAAPASAAPPPRTAEHADRPPLAVSIETMTPSTVPRRGRITLTGEIRNRSQSTWTELNVYLFASSVPMTTSAELAEATATDETLEVGARITTPGLYDEVDDLAPGESTGYRLSVPVADLPFTDPGVYWLGVHVLGTNEEGRVDGADGRARTFVPLVRGPAQRTSLSLVVPLRAPVTRTAEGQLGNPQGWGRRLGAEGRLGRLADLAETAIDVPLTWVVDPAVLDAARSLADGNPAFDLAPPAEDRPGGSPSPDSPLTQAPAPGDPGAGDPGTGDTGTGDPQADDPQGDDPGVAPDEPEEQLGQLTEEAGIADAWLRGLLDRLAEADVLTVPYGDLDVATVLRGGFDGTFENSYRLATDAMEQLGLDADPVVAPLSGLLPDAALERLDPGLPLLLSERAADADAVEVQLRQGSRALLTSDVARVGGPTPTPPFDALSLRQRILSEAAVHGLTYGPDRPLVVSTPELWDPGRDWRSASFFAGLDVPWLRIVSLTTARAMSETEVYEGPLSYARALRRSELPEANVLATQELGTAGGVLATLLTENDTIDEQVARAAMLGSSTHARAYPRRARAATRAISAQVHGRLTQVYVEGSPLVTMSSETGNFSVTVVNDLQEPVTVGIDAETGTDRLVIRAPDVVSLGPGQRATVRLAVRATDIGVHSVRIVPTTKDGRPLGRSTVVKVRSSQVGLVIWLIMGTGAVVLVGAVGARIVRRVRRRQRTHGPLLRDLPS